MSVPEVKDKYKSKDEELKRLPQCDYCPFEEMLKGRYTKAGIIDEDIPEGQHPHRDTIEDACGQGVDVPCEMKYAIMRTPISDRNVAQMRSMITFRSDLGKYFHREIDMNTAGMEWGKERDSLVDADGNPGSSYAKRWEEVWDLSLCSNGKHSLKEIGMYRILFSDNDEYLTWVNSFRSLTPEEKARHISGIKLED